MPKWWTSIGRFVSKKINLHWQYHSHQENTENCFNKILHPCPFLPLDHLLLLYILFCLVWGRNKLFCEILHQISNKKEWQIWEDKWCRVKDKCWKHILFHILSILFEFFGHFWYLLLWGPFGYSSCVVSQKIWFIIRMWFS